MCEHNVDSTLESHSTVRVTDYVIREQGTGSQKWMYVLQSGRVLMFSCYRSFLPSLSSFFPPSSTHLSCQERAEKATDSAPASQRGCPVSGGDLSWGGWGWGGRDLPFPPTLPPPHPVLWPRGPSRGGHSKALQGQDEGSAGGQLLQRWAWLPGCHHGATSHGYLSNTKRRILLLFKLSLLWKPISMFLFFRRRCTMETTCVAGVSALCPAAVQGRSHPLTPQRVHHDQRGGLLWGAGHHRPAPDVHYLAYHQGTHKPQCVCQSSPSSWV